MALHAELVSSQTKDSASALPSSSRTRAAAGEIAAEPEANGTESRASPWFAADCAAAAFAAAPVPAGVPDGAGAGGCPSTARSRAGFIA